VKARGAIVGQLPVASGVEVPEDGMSGIGVRGEAELYDGPRRLIDGEHSGERVAAGFDRVVMRQHGRLKLRLPRAGVIAVFVTQDVVVDADYRRVSPPAARDVYRPFICLEEMSAPAFRVSPQSIQVTLRLRPDSHQPGAYAQPEPQPRHRGESTEYCYGFHCKCLLNDFERPLGLIPAFKLRALNV
jgi:hypothetical protein